MHVVRILAALVFGGLASIALAHLLADSFRPIWGDQAAVRAVFSAPVVIVFAALSLIFMVRSPREQADTVFYNTPIDQPPRSTVHVEVTVNVARAEALRDFSEVSFGDLAEHRSAYAAGHTPGARCLEPGVVCTCALPRLQG
jgi:hypothetical protein